MKCNTVCNSAGDIPTDNGHDADAAGRDEGENDDGDEDLLLMMMMMMM